MYWPEGKVRAGHPRLFIQSMIVRLSRRTSFPASEGNNILRISDKYVSGAKVRDIRPQTKTPRNDVSISPGNWCYRRCELTASMEGLHLLVRVRHITRPACPKQQHFYLSRVPPTDRSLNHVRGAIRQLLDARLVPSGSAQVEIHPAILNSVGNHRFNLGLVVGRLTARPINS